MHRQTDSFLIAILHLHSMQHSRKSVQFVPTVLVFCCSRDLLLNPHTTSSLTALELLRCLIVCHGEVDTILEVKVSNE